MNSTPLRIAHITDTHILAEPGAEVYGVDSFVALERLVARMLRDAWKPDLIIVTGDVSEDATAASYMRFSGLFSVVGLPVYCVPGNHDVLEEMHLHLESSSVHLPRYVDREPWRIILLNSQVPGRVHGALAESELAALEGALASSTAEHVLVGLHHPPVSVCPMPMCNLENAADFLAVLGRYPAVRGVIAGHVHCEADELRDGIRLLATPAVCMQCEHPAGTVAAGEQDFMKLHRLDPARHGFRRLELHPDGRIVTEVVWQ